MVRTRKIEHVGLRVFDLAESEAFYTGLRARVEPGVRVANIQAILPTG
jgi:catechol 2,3-dioxygenase-like lactoylglutathione lyase family enzyme